MHSVKNRIKILCHVALICIIYCITDMICTVVCQEIEVVRFLGSLHHCLFLSNVNQTTGRYTYDVLENCLVFKFSHPHVHLCPKCFHSLDLGRPIFNYYQNSEYETSKTKVKFLTTTVIIFFINNKPRCTYFNSLMPSGSERSNLLKQTCNQMLLF